MPGPSSRTSSLAHPASAVVLQCCAAPCAYLQALTSRLRTIVLTALRSARTKSGAGPKMRSSCAGIPGTPSLSRTLTATLRSKSSGCDSRCASRRASVSRSRTSKRMRSDSLLIASSAASRTAGLATSAPAQHVDVALERRQRGAQLVRRIGDEAAHLRLGILLRRKGFLDAVGHVVEAAGELSDLVTAWCQPASRGEVSGGELLGSRGEAAHRAQRAAGEQHAEASARISITRPPGRDEQDLVMQHVGDRRHRDRQLRDAAGARAGGDGEADDELVTAVSGDLLRDRTRASVHDALEHGANRGSAGLPLRARPLLR